MSTEYTHNPETLENDIALVERLKGTYDSDCDAYYIALDNILRFAKWVKLGTNGALDNRHLTVSKCACHTLRCVININ